MRAAPTGVEEAEFRRVDIGARDRRMQLAPPARDGSPRRSNRFHLPPPESNWLLPLQTRPRCPDVPDFRRSRNRRDRATPATPGRDPAALPKPPPPAAKCSEHLSDRK